MQVGDHVYLRAYGDEVIQRRIVAFGHSLIYICRDDEYAAAKREGREPVSVGFPLADIVQADDSSQPTGE